jgi:hypothetical protein
MSFKIPLAAPYLRERPEKEKGKEEKRKEGILQRKKNKACIRRTCERNL